jgi:ketosteroid isomerase-like protein
MNNITLKSLLVFLFVFHPSITSQSTNNYLSIESEQQLVEKAIHNCIGWAKNKDINLLYSVIAIDTSFLEVHPNDKVVMGFEDFKKAEKFWMSPDFKAVRYEIRDLKINFSKSGEVAWFFCMLDDINEWKGQPANWENTRWTGVLEKRDGKWIIVQQHFSFASK